MSTISQFLKIPHGSALIYYEATLNRNLICDKLNDVVQLMEVHAPMVARKCEPGQFIILRVGEDGERIPLTIADYDREKETITIIYQIVGYSTKQLAKLEEGDYITDFVGPLGVPTHLEIPTVKKTSRTWY